MVCDSVIPRRKPREVAVARYRTHQLAPSRDNGSENVTASPARKTPVRAAVKDAGSEVKKVVTTVSDNIKKALSSGKGGTR